MPIHFLPKWFLICWLRRQTNTLKLQALREHRCPRGTGAPPQRSFILMHFTSVKWTRSSHQTEPTGENLRAMYESPGQIFICLHQVNRQTQEVYLNVHRKSVRPQWGRWDPTEKCHLWNTESMSPIIGVLIFIPSVFRRKTSERFENNVNFLIHSWH